MWPKVETDIQTRSYKWNFQIATSIMVSSSDQMHQEFSRLDTHTLFVSVFRTGFLGVAPAVLEVAL